jgi:hypothetical protein
MSYNVFMSKNVISDFGVCEHQKSDNPQEMLKIKAKSYYYSGFFAGEMSCSVIRARTHNKNSGYYYTVDFTVSNNDKNLLHRINEVVMKDGGVISPIKGAYNLKVRGKERVRNVLNFLEEFPILTGDLAKNRIDLLKQALFYLENNRGKNKSTEKMIKMEQIRNSLKQLKFKGIVNNVYNKQIKLSDDAKGYFLSGVLDGEGSFGFKSNGRDSKEPFFIMAMKDRKIIELLREFIQYGNVRYRKDGLYHYEVNQREALKRICCLFLKHYPLQHQRQRKRMQRLQQILND